MLDTGTLCPFVHERHGGPMIIIYIYTYTYVSASVCMCLCEYMCVYVSEQQPHTIRQKDTPVGTGGGVETGRGFIKEARAQVRTSVLATYHAHTRMTFVRGFRHLPMTVHSTRHRKHTHAHEHERMNAERIRDTWRAQRVVCLCLCARRVMMCGEHIHTCTCISITHTHSRDTTIQSQSHLIHIIFVRTGVRYKSGVVENFIIYCIIIRCATAALLLCCWALAQTLQYDECIIMRPSVHANIWCSQHALMRSADVRLYLNCMTQYTQGEN